MHVAPATKTRLVHVYVRCMSLLGLLLAGADYKP